MKKSTAFSAILLLGVTLASLSFSFAPQKPLGTVYWQDNLYMDSREVSNLDWKKYVNWLKENDPASLTAAMPNQHVWETGTPNAAFRNTYYGHKAFDAYPVVGISHQQAKDYCAWRSKVVNESRKDKTKVLYRLPTKKEWEAVAELPLTENQLTQEYANEPNMLYNLASQEQPQNYISAPTESYIPNELGIYNMIGNLAEMVEEEGIAKGGSWYHSYEEAMPSNDLRYEGETPWLGFRCICELTQ